MSQNLKSPLPQHPGIVFMGTPDFAVMPLKSMIDGGHRILSVVTQPDRPRGRGRNITASPIKELALTNGIRVMQPEKIFETGFLTAVKELAPDLIVVVAFGQILKKTLLDMPGWGVINIHASLLPRYRGAAPIQRAILNDESMTGLTIMRMEVGLDTGPVLYQRQVPILKDETAGHLHDRLAAVSGDFLMEFLSAWTGGRIKETVQDPGLATYADKIDKAMCRIDWSRSAKDISAQVRGLDPMPGAYTTLGDNNLKLFSSTFKDRTAADGVPGRIVSTGGGVVQIQAGTGILEVREIQCPGKKRLPVKDFLMGFDLHEGTILGR